MKKTILSISIIGMFSICTNKGFAQTDPAYDSIASLNLNAYASLPVDSLLQHIPQSYNYMKIVGYTTGNRAQGLYIRYATGMLIWIAPKTYSYMNPIDPTSTWNLTLFKKEIASYISVIHPDFHFLRGDPIGTAQRGH